MKMSLKSVIKDERLVMDGAMGTELEYILPKDSKLHPKSSPLWSGMALVHNPNLVEQVHKSYVTHGAQILLTLTYQTSYASLKKYTSMNDDEIYKLWAQSVRVCRRALGSHRGWVFGSIGPYATYLADLSEYTGIYKDATKSDIQDYHLPLAQYYVNCAGVDAIAFETIPNFSECKVVFNLMLKLIQIKPKCFYVSFNFKDGNSMTDGTPIKKLVQYINMKLAKHPELEENFLGMGLNCLDFDLVDDVILSINGESSTSMPLIVYPNLGYYCCADQDKYLLDRDHVKWERLVSQWFSYPNVRVVGGCCLTTPTEIQIIKNVLTANSDTK